MVMTSASRGIVDTARRRGFEVNVRDPYRGRFEVTLNRSDAFGVVYVGARSGRILRSVVRDKWGDLIGQADGANATRHLIATACGCPNC